MAEAQKKLETAGATKRQSKAPAVKKSRFRSSLEVNTAAYLERKKVAYAYEAVVISYEKPAQSARYTPDFILPNGIIIETKGRFTTEDRKKHRNIKEQHPDLDIRFVFCNPNTKISKRSKTTYKMWCDRYGFKSAKLTIPEAWLNEPADPTRITALEKVETK